MRHPVSPKLFFAAICLLSVSTFAQKGKPTACPVPQPPSGDTMCFGDSGCLDTSFSTDGFLLFRPTLGNITDISIQKATVQADGKIVGVGQIFDAARTTHRDIFVIRIDSAGQLDTSFGDVDPFDDTQRLGYIIDQVGVSETPADTGQAIAIQSDGSIVVAGSSDSKSVVVRYTPEGQRDTSFGSGGVVRPGVGAFSMDLAIQTDGKILAHIWDRLTVARLNTNGTLDSSFGSGGIAAHNVSATAYGMGSARSMALQVVPTANGSEERIVLGGYGFDATTRKAQGSAVNQFALARLTSSGSIDTTFGVNGRRFSNLFGFNDRIFALTVDQQNKIVAAGQSTVGPCENDLDTGVARYSQNGTLEWKAKVDFYGYRNWAYDVKTQVVAGDLKVLGFGMSAYFTSPTPDLGVFRLNSNGTPDATFGPGTFGPGKVTFNISTTDHGLGGAIQSDNKIVVVGSSSGGDPTIAATITRYLP